MMQVLVEDARPLLEELLTCRFLSQRLDISTPFFDKIAKALAASGLPPGQSAELTQRIASVEPLISEDQPLALAMVFCDQRPSDRAEQYDLVFGLAKLIDAAAQEKAGKDDALLVGALKEIALTQSNSAACVRLDTGPFRKRKPLTPESPLVKELNRFDLSRTVRAHVERTLIADPDLSRFQTYGDLLAHCRAREVEFYKTKTLPPGPKDILKALQPAK